MISILRYIIIRTLGKIHVLIDGADGSLTVSRSLYYALLLCGLKRCNKLLTFYIPFHNSYGFYVECNHANQIDTDYAPLLYSEKFQTFGFVPPTPSVAAILSHYNLPYNYKKNIPVRPRYAKGLVYFQLMVK